MVHLWLALSPHGFGHAVMTAPLIREVRRRHPGLRLTIQTALPEAFLATRYDAFELVTDIPDIGFRMKSPMEVDAVASAEFYTRMHSCFTDVVAQEARRLNAAKPDLVLANVPYVTIAAAKKVGIPVLAFSSLNWFDIGRNYLSGLPEMDRVLDDMHEAYAGADVFLRAEPGQPMTLPNVVDIGTVAALGTGRADEIRCKLQLQLEGKIGLITYGGIEHRLPLERWPVIPGWFWLGNQPSMPKRPDMAHWQDLAMPFQDVSCSVDLLITKTGYGTFSEAGIKGIPVLYEARPDWPEAPSLEKWLARHTRCLAVEADQLLRGDLPGLLHKLFSQSPQQVAYPDGIGQGADIIDRYL